MHGKSWPQLKVMEAFKAQHYENTILEKQESHSTNSKQKQLRWKKECSMKHRLKRNVLIISIHRENFCLMNISDKGKL